MIFSVAARTLLPTLLDSLQKIASKEDPLRFHVVSTTYHPFISLFHMLGMTNSKTGKQLKGIRKPTYTMGLLLH